MDLKSWLVISLIYVIKCILMIKIESAEEISISYLGAICVSTWIPGAIALVVAQLEYFKIPIVCAANHCFSRILLSAICIGMVMLVGKESYIYAVPYQFVILFGVLQAICETLFWWGYVYKKLEYLHPIRMFLIIGLLWGLWHTPEVLMVSSSKHDLSHIMEVMAALLYFLAASPLMLYFRLKGRSILVPAIFYYAMIEGARGLQPMIVLSVCSCVALFLLWKDGAFGATSIAKSS